MKASRGILAVAGVALLALMATTIFRPQLKSGARTLMNRMQGKFSVEDRVTQFGPLVRIRLAGYFAHARVAYPPQRVLVLGLKQEKRLEVYAAEKDSSWRFVRSYPVLAASGSMGPKRRQGDGQVPEGFYRVESLNPNSRFHLALRVSYPNALDLKHAKLDGIGDPGGDIMIHGSDVSVGCLAMGDEVAEDLFVLAAETGYQNVEIVLSPLDFRNEDVSSDATRPQWVKDLYAELREAVRKLPREAEATGPR